MKHWRVNKVSKELELTKAERGVLGAVLENQQQATVQDLRIIDKICDILEQEKVVFDDEQYSYVKDKFNNFTNWNPSKEYRKIILSLAEKL